MENKNILDDITNYRFSSAKLYELASGAQYNNMNNIAYTLFHKIIEVYPASNLADEAKTQINKIKTKYPHVNFVPDSAISNFYEKYEKDTSVNTKQDSGWVWAFGKSGQGRYKSGWILGMQIISWIAFSAIGFGGTVFSASFEDGFVFFCGFLISFVVAFLQVAMTMIFLNLAQDVSEINQILRKRDNN
ncbi:MAG: hypothetical protein FWF82_05985 [Oscillospiraceae bacterium]|nr:hypothetical protein [Oscillospiraceae bacterium]